MQKIINRQTLFVPLNFFETDELQVSINIPFKVSDIVLKSVVIYDFKPESTSGTKGILMLRSPLVPYEIMHAYAIPNVGPSGLPEDVDNYALLSNPDVAWKVDQASIRGDYNFRLTRFDGANLAKDVDITNVEVQMVLTLEFTNIL